MTRDVFAFQVEVFSKVMGRTGSRPTIHSILHAVEAIRLHGESVSNVGCGSWVRVDLVERHSLDPCS